MVKSGIPGPMPAPRDFGWPLKTPETSHFEIMQRDNGQFIVVLNHALLRGVSAEMLTWWFRTFTRLRVTLDDVPRYEGQTVPARLLWHPSDHFDAMLTGEIGPDGTPIAGRTRIHIQAAMQYQTYGWDYPVHTELMVAYVGGDGCSMGRILPFFGPAMILRIHFRDVGQGGTHLGVHYHYEIVIGVRGNDPVSRFISRRITHMFGPQFFEAWRTHNVIEVGTFEHFLPVLYPQHDAAMTCDIRRTGPTSARPNRKSGRMLIWSPGVWQLSLVSMIRWLRWSMTNGHFCDAKRLHPAGLSMPPVLQIALGLILIAVTLGIHLIAVNISLRRVTGHIAAVRAHGGVIAKTALVMVYVMVLRCALLVEAFIWALALVSLDVVTGFWPAIYFAIATLTTLGYGDLVPSDSARLVAAFCAVAGLFLVGLNRICHRNPAPDRDGQLIVISQSAT